MSQPSTTLRPARTLRLSMLGALVALFLLHNDFWLWEDGSIVAGLPVGLLYHVAYCGVVSLVFAWIVVGGRPDE